MSDEMIGAILPLILQSATASSASGQSGSSQGTDEFQQMLTSLLLASSLSSQSSTTGSTANGGLLSPLMMTLFEQLLSQQLVGQNTAAQGLSATFSETTTTPHGTPVRGPLTQDFLPGHNGMDYGVVVGTAAKATMDGEVVYAGWNDQGYGNLVIVQNGAYSTYYAHLSEIPVRVGQHVKAGSVIGLTGNTGRSTGPHIHYEVRKNGTPIDPNAVA